MPSVKSPKSTTNARAAAVIGKFTTHHRRDRKQLAPGSPGHSEYPGHPTAVVRGAQRWADEGAAALMQQHCLGGGLVRGLGLCSGRRQPP